MSWDLYLVPGDHGSDVGEWLEEHAEDGHDAEDARRHAEAVIARRPGLEVSGPYGADYQITLPEDAGLPLDVGLYGNHASISVAYWDLGERTADLREVVVDIVTALRDETGWVIYDPQEDRLIGAEEVSALFGSGHAHGVSIVDRITKPAEEPRKKRRFGLF